MTQCSLSNITTQNQVDPTTGHLVPCVTIVSPDGLSRTACPVTSSPQGEVYQGKVASYMAAKSLVSALDPVEQMSCSQTILLPSIKKWGLCDSTVLTDVMDWVNRDTSLTASEATQMKKMHANYLHIIQSGCDNGSPPQDRNGNSSISNKDPLSEFRKHISGIVAPNQTHSNNQSIYIISLIIIFIIVIIAISSIWWVRKTTKKFT